ncbi:MAG: hypothetical protein ABW150_08645 [Candidatus Thiodiazotropha sp.]
MDEKSTPTIGDYQRELSALGWSTLPLLEVDARKKGDVSLLVQSLLYSLDPTLAN